MVLVSRAASSGFPSTSNSCEKSHRPWSRPLVHRSRRNRNAETRQLNTYPTQDNIFLIICSSIFSVASSAFAPRCSKNVLNIISVTAASSTMPGDGAEIFLEIIRN